MKDDLKNVTVKVKATEEERKLWAVAAAVDGRSLSAWARKACAEKLMREKEAGHGNS